MAHPLSPRPLQPRPQRGLRLGGCRDGACRPSPYPPGTGRNPPPASAERSPNPQPPGTGARGSSSQSSGVYFPPAPRGKEALMMFWTLIPATSPPLLWGRKQTPMLCNATGTLLPAPLTGGEVPISTRDAGICTLLPAPQGEKSSPRASPAKVYAAPISAPRRKMPHTSAACIPMISTRQRGKHELSPAICDDRALYAPATGFEPVTVRLTVGCSAVELRGIAT